ncbi:MAG: hypothetical protein IJ711_06755 [Lachnospiraceae bacterium]|nr:hypothetical protein [Lachnospiraceae bacterium]
MYSKLPNLVMGFHGCSDDTYQAVLFNNQHLKRSENKYDWLGNGIYFWENSYERAVEWATEKYGDSGMVIGAILDLGNCLNLTDYHSTAVLKLGYELLAIHYENVNRELPKNTNGRSAIDLLARNLDCAVIQEIHKYNELSGNEMYDSVRGVFIEGGEVYPGSGFVEKTHTQICIVNPNCIKGYFAPREMVDGYGMP